MILYRLCKFGVTTQCVGEAYLMWSSALRFEEARISDDNTDTASARGRDVEAMEIV